MLKVATFSVVVGGRACNARCPFCVSKMTGLPEYQGKFHEANFHTACLLARAGQTTTVLLTGKGEPTLYPKQIDTYLYLLERYEFPFFELQTNGITIGHLAAGNSEKAQPLTEEILLEWSKYGLSTIALSVVSVDNTANAQVYNPDYPDLAGTIKYLRRLDYTVRLCVMMMWGKDCVSRPEDIQTVMEFCRDNDVAQLSVRPIRCPNNTHDQEASDFVRCKELSGLDIIKIRSWAEDEGNVVLRLAHGAVVYDIKSQNLCLTDCLTPVEGTDEIRTLIFYPDGKLTYDWQYPGAILLSGRGP